MATYRRETRVSAPLEDVWSFHSTPDGLESITPPFMNLEVHSVVGPDGESDPEVLDAGSRIRLSIRPFGVGPRRSWTSLVTERRRTDHAAVFRDVMVDGPFEKWEHAHKFLVDGEQTVIVDRVEYELPGGAIGRAVSPIGRIGLETLFCDRHRRTRQLFG